MAPIRTIATSPLTTLLLTLLALPATSLAQTSNSDFNSEYNSTKKTINGGRIAIIVVVVVLGVFGIASGIAFCCVLSRNRKRRERQAREVQAANQKAAERRAREGGYEADPQQLEDGGLRPYQYGPAAAPPYHNNANNNGRPVEMDGNYSPREMESREKAEMP